MLSCKGEWGQALTAGTTEEGTNVVVNLMRTFKSLLVVPMTEPGGMRKGMDEDTLFAHVDSVFIFSLTWSIGGSAGSNEAWDRGGGGYLT